MLCLLESVGKSDPTKHVPKTDNCVEAKNLKLKMKECMADDCVNVGLDFETVMHDIPVDSLRESSGPFTYSE